METTMKPNPKSVIEEIREALTLYIYIYIYIYRERERERA